MTVGVRRLAYSNVPMAIIIRTCRGGALVSFARTLVQSQAMFAVELLRRKAQLFVMRGDHYARNAEQGVQQIFLFPLLLLRKRAARHCSTYGNLNRKNQRMVEMASSKFSSMFDFRDPNVTLRAPRHQSPVIENRKHSGRDADTCNPLGGVSRSRVDTRSASILMRATRKSRTRWQNYQRSISSSDLRQLGTMEPR